ncbi:response regulator, partial [Paenibacillus sepulcri]|nr:response regulator [Paenibacillus sepulcri]
MIRLLIVDDEPYTVDGLYEMLENTADLELELYRAYAPEEAVEWLTRTKMDIVLSDIRMPGMTGLELQKWVVSQWPRCKIIFLTGIRELQTAQEAIRTGSVDYILKTEGDEAILRSIRKAMEDLREETRSDQFMLQAKEQMHKALPLLHREWFTSLLDPHFSGSMVQARMQELDIPLSLDLELIPVIGRIDRSEENADSRDQMLLLYAIQNIAAEFFETAVFFSVNLDANHLVLLIQPSGHETHEVKACHSAALWRKTGSFVQGTLESVQETCLRLLEQPVSFISPAYPVTWTGLSRAYANMRHKLVLGIGTGVGMLMSVDPLDEGGGSDPLPPVRMMMDKLERLMNEGL